MIFRGRKLSTQHNRGEILKRGYPPLEAFQLGVSRGGRNRNLPLPCVVLFSSPFLLDKQEKRGASLRNVLRLWSRRWSANSFRGKALERNRNLPLPCVVLFPPFSWTSKRKGSVSPVLCTSKEKMDSDQGKTKTQGGNESRPAFVVILPFSSPVSGRSSSPSRRA